MGQLAREEKGAATSLFAYLSLLVLLPLVFQWLLGVWALSVAKGQVLEAMEAAGMAALHEIATGAAARGDLALQGGQVEGVARAYLARNLAQLSLVAAPGQEIAGNMRVQVSNVPFTDALGRSLPAYSLHLDGQVPVKVMGRVYSVQVRRDLGLERR